MLHSSQRDNLSETRISRKAHFSRATEVVECRQMCWNLHRMQHICSRYATKILICIGHFSVEILGNVLFCAFLQAVQQTMNRLRCRKSFLESYNYCNIVEDLSNSKKVQISKVCDSVGEEYYYYKNINYIIQDSPVEYFKCIYNFILLLEKYDTKELVNISINNVVGIEEGNFGENYSKYYFVIPKQESLDTLAYEEKLDKDKSEIEYDMRQITIYF